VDDLTAVLASRCGVIARRQVLGCALTPADLARLVRRRDLTRVHSGVYVDHTGPLTWDQRAWAAVLFSWPAAPPRRPGRCPHPPDGGLRRADVVEHGLTAVLDDVAAGTWSVLEHGYLNRVERPHDSTTSRDRDMHRDLDGAAEDAAMTLRLSWGQVFDRPCRTADRVARVLVRRGWSGHARRCPDCG
jgi:hypothetical protein